LILSIDNVGEKEDIDMFPAIDGFILYIHYWKSMECPLFLSFWIL
jgi:hypothetical protein